MVETLWDKITQFVSPEAGQRRRAALDEFGRDIGYYVPPEMRGILGMVAESTPTASIDRASQRAVSMVQPGRTAGQRIGDLGGLLSETAGVVAPALVGPRAGMTATQALEEMFMMPAAGVDDVARQFAADESGALRLTRGNYTGGHSAPPIEPGATLDNPTTMFGGDDIYTRNAMQYFGTGDPRMDQQSLSVIQKMRNSPDADVTIYRAVPTGAPDEIGAGDWVTLSPEYAKLHGESVLDGDYRVVKEKVKASELATEGNSIHEWGWWPSEARLNQRALPAPRNEAEAVAREILEMRAAGRAGDVTDELMAQADPQYMFANTPLPMDEASRMARADQMFPDTGYHATTADFQAFDPLMRGTATDAGWFGNADYFSPSSQYAERFVSFPAENPLVIPARLNRGNVYDWRAMEADRGGRGLGNNADAALQTRERLEREGFNSVEVSNPIIKADAPLSDEMWSSMIRADPSIEMMGRENVSKSLQAGIPRKSLEDYYSAEMLDLLPTQRIIDEIALFSPNQTRSRFARFDPEFRHLRNLSAGVGGLGLLATQSPEQQREEELRQYLGGLR